MKLNQINTLVGGRKTAIKDLLTKIYNHWKREACSGISRVYRPKDDDGERFPSEQQRVQLRVRDELKRVTDQLEEFWDLVATQDKANTQARADIVIDDEVLVPQVPVTTLMFLDKQLADLSTAMGNLPVLPPDKMWKWDDQNRWYVTDPETTVKTRKLPKVIVKYEATKEHPAQTELVASDETIGWWDTVHISGCISASDLQEILSRISKLRAAVKVARQGANGADAAPQAIGGALLDYLFAN